MKRFIAFLLSLSIFIGTFGNLGFAAEGNSTDVDYEKDNRGLIVDETLDPMPDDNDVVEIPDWNLKRGIVLIHGGTEDDVDNAVITKRMIRRVHKLSPEQCGAHNRQEIGIKVKDISGLEYATNLEWLSLVYQAFTDLEPLKNSNKMVHLDLRSLGTDGDRVTDISPLKNMTELEFLNLDYAKIEDTSILSNFTKMKILNLSFTRIDNYDFASNMKDLEYIRSDFSPIRSLEPLRGLTKLKTILASAPQRDYTKPINDNLIDSVQPLKDLTNLKELDLASHNIKDITPLKNLKNLKKVVLSNNQIQDLQTLLALPNLEVVWVQGNPGYAGYESSEYDYLGAKEIFNSLNKETLTKEDIPALEKFEKASKGLKSFFNDDTLNTLMGYKEELKTSDSIKNDAFEFVDTKPVPEDPKPEEPEETGIKKVVEVFDPSEITVKKGTDISKLLPEMVKVKLAPGGIETKDNEAKIGTFRRNFRDGQEFGPTSIAYKIVDENGNVISFKGNPEMLKGISQDEYKKEIYFNPVGDFYEYVTTGEDHFFNLEVVSDKYEIVGEYGFKQEYCIDYRDGTVRDVMANGEALNRHDANKEPEKFYVIQVKEKQQEPETPETPTDNPKLGIGKDGAYQTITYRVETTDGEILSSQEFPGLISGYNMNPDYVKRPTSVGDYYTIKSDGATEEYKIQLHSKDYELVGTYEFNMDFNMEEGRGGIVTVVTNSNTKPSYYKTADGEIPEEVFVIKVKPFGAEDPVDPAPIDPTPEEPTTGLGITKEGKDDAITFKVVDEKGNVVSASENPTLFTAVGDASDYKIAPQIDNDFFKFVTTSDEAKYDIRINSSDYVLDGEYYFNIDYDMDSYGGKISILVNSKVPNKTYYKVDEDDIPQEAFIIHVKSKEDNILSAFDKLPVLFARTLNNLTATDDTMDLKVDWNLDNFKDEVGKYVLEGELVLPEGITNPQGLKAKITVNVIDDEEKPSDPSDSTDETDTTKPSDSTENPDTTKPSKPSPGVPSDTQDSNKPTDVTNIVTTRTKGKDRYETAIEISKKMFNKSDVVIVADGRDFPDSLTATVLAKYKNAPLLLSDEGKALEKVVDEISRLNAKEIILVGGKSSVSLNEEGRFKELGEVTRIFGDDRYETSLKVAEFILKENPEQKTVIVADGRNYPDALAIASVAGRENMPIILSNKAGIGYAQKLLDKFSIKDAIIVGGKDSVDKNVESRFEKSTRLAGMDRYETAVMIAEKFFTDTKEIALVNGKDFPDALVVGGYAAMNNMPILLTRPERLDKYVKDYISRNKIEKVNIFGGEDSVAKDIIK